MVVSHYCAIQIWSELTGEPADSSNARLISHIADYYSFPLIGEGRRVLAIMTSAHLVNQGKDKDPVRAIHIVCAMLNSAYGGMSRNSAEHLASDILNCYVGYAESIQEVIPIVYRYNNIPYPQDVLTRILIGIVRNDPEAINDLFFILRQESYFDSLDMSEAPEGGYVVYSTDHLGGTFSS